MGTVAVAGVSRGIPGMEEVALASVGERSGLAPVSSIVFVACQGNLDMAGAVQTSLIVGPIPAGPASGQTEDLLEMLGQQDPDLDIPPHD